MHLIMAELLVLLAAPALLPGEPQVEGFAAEAERRVAAEKAVGVCHNQIVAVLYRCPRSKAALGKADGQSRPY